MNPIDLAGASAIIIGGDRGGIERAATKPRLGSPDILVSNAVISGPNFPLTEYPQVEWRRVIEIYLIGVFNCCCAAPGGAAP
jgi:NAD(P)-dependent dehydrogenase (short-subunit alcohol dehydrogenase family)